MNRYPRIEVYDGVFESELLAQITSMIGGISWQDGWHTNDAVPYTIFHASFADPGKSNRDDVSAQLAPWPELESAWSVVRDDVLREPRKLLRCYANMAEFGREGFQHRDTDIENRDDLTAVIYLLSPQWKTEFFGETALLRDNEIIKSVMPRNNRLFLFPSNMMHIARGVTQLCDKRRVTLIFKSGPQE